MARSIDLQDTLSKTQAVERVYKSLQQGPELDQRQFALNLKRAVDEEREKVEKSKKGEKPKVKDEKDEKPKKDSYESERESDNDEPETAIKTSSGDNSPSSEHKIDMTV
jgi:hypothetical protein